MTVTVADIIRMTERIAPSILAEEWDNPGLQVGQKTWPVRSIWIALDPLPSVISAACRQDIDLLITHHPLIFHPLKSLDFNTPVGAIIHKAIQNNLCIFSAHTNLDSVRDGINDILAARIGLRHLSVLKKRVKTAQCKLVIYLPAEYEEKVLNALFETKAGKIGEYSCCTFRNPGKGTFKPSDQAKPFTGKAEEISHADEIRIETVIQQSDLKDVIQHIRRHHPYETMAYDVYPLLADEENRSGLGRIGELAEEISLGQFARHVKEKLGLASVKVAGDPDLFVNQVAICSGSGSGLMQEFFSSGAQVYITGDLRYHDARDAEAANLGLIDIGHFASEHLIVNVLAKQLQDMLLQAGMQVTVEPYGSETDPFVVI